MMGGDISLEEVVRRLDTLQRSFDAMDDRYVGNREYLADMRTQSTRDEGHDRRLGRVEDQQAWIMRGLAALSFGLLAQFVAIFTGGAPL